ncbi:hypothetical protein C8J34_104144 [Rhizobium sp. PP-F2F-G36]|nr:hypothetical protein C8J34_104144 [Rhizobium sp. PP-F2F-G36]
MRPVAAWVATLLVLTAGTAAAEVILNASPLPCIYIEGNGMFCGQTLDIKYRPGDGDHALLRIYGHENLQLVGLPSFVRDVLTTYGRLLRGKPEPGNYTVGVWRDGKRIPTQDMHLRFIPR